MERDPNYEENQPLSTNYSGRFGFERKKKYFLLHTRNQFAQNWEILFFVNESEVQTSNSRNLSP